MKPTITWIVVADGARARIFVNRGPGKGIELSERELTADHQRTSDMVRDSLPRTHDSVGPARHAIEPKVRRRPKRNKRGSRFEYGSAF